MTYRIEERLKDGTVTASKPFDDKPTAEAFWAKRLAGSKWCGTYAPAGRYRLVLLGPDRKEAS